MKRTSHDILSSIVGFAVVASLLSANSGHSAPFPEGNVLAQSAFDRYEGDTSLAEVEMTLTNTRQQSEVRTLSITAKATAKQKKELIRFSSPRDIAGTGFLSRENESGGSDQFLYLPALKRARRIGSDQRQRRFVGTDFAYEDLDRIDVEAFTHKVIGAERHAGRECWILESVRKQGANTGYTKLVRWIDKTTHFDMRVDYFDTTGSLLKRLNVSELKQIDGIWTAVDTEMQDFRETHRTRLKVMKIEYNKAISDEKLTRSHLESA